MARKNETGLTPAVIEYYRNTINPATGKKWTQADIARKYNVSSQYISWIKRQYGGVTKTPRERARELWPFNVPREFQLASPSRRLRDHLLFIVTGGEGVVNKDLVLLRGFYRKLRDEKAVVEFDPEIPPSDGIFTGGWAYRCREEYDEDLMIRVNQYCAPLDDVARKIWRIPSVAEYPQL